MKKVPVALSALVVSLACAMPCRAEWKPVGELHVSSQKVLMSQVKTLADQMKFPFLTMMVQGGMEDGEMAQTIGSIDPSADWGAKLYAEGTNVVTAWAWPVAGGKKGWKDAHPDAKAEEVLFTKDGRFACVSDEPALAKKLAASGTLFAKPIKKGILRVNLEGEEFFSNIESVLGGKINESEESGMMDAESRKQCDMLAASFKSLKRYSVLLGVCKSGLDARMRATPKKGATTDALLETLKGLGDVVEPSDKSVAAVFPESAQTKPVLVVKCTSTPAMGASPAGASAPAWLFVWRDGVDLRAIARIASADLATMSQSMMNIQMQ